MTVTPEQLAGWKALAERATPGPWEVCAYDSGNPAIGQKPCRWTWVNEIQGGAAGRMTIADAQFVAACRVAVPALIEALEVAQRDTERLDWLERQDAIQVKIGRSGWDWSQHFDMESHGTTLRAVIDVSLECEAALRVSPPEEERTDG